LIFVTKVILDFCLARKEEVEVAEVEVEAEDAKKDAEEDEEGCGIDVVSIHCKSNGNHNF
jgi:hypothetical protein